MTDLVPNPILLFNNHFAGHRRTYPYRTRLAIAADLGYDGYEFHPIEPDDDVTWNEAETAFRESGLGVCGMYVVAGGAADDEVANLDNEILRVRRIIERLATWPVKPFLNLSIKSNPNPRSKKYEESGSAFAEERHWERGGQIVREADRLLQTHGMQGNLYTHVWFLCDTPEAEVRLIEAAQAEVIRPGVACFHSHFHPGVPDAADWLDAPGMDRLGYVALLNAWAKPEPFRTLHLDEGNIDIAGLLALLWQRQYQGPLVMQAYDIGGDPYVSAQRSITYVQSVAERFARNPRLNPLYESEGS